MRRVSRRVDVRPLRWRPPGLAEWQLGLRAAREIRRNFPAFYAAHVAGRPATASALLGVGAALVTLVATTVELDDTGLDYYAELQGSSPAWALEHPPAALSNGEDPWCVLEDFLHRPALMVYGLDLGVEDQEDFPALAVALAAITGRAFFAPEDLAAVLGVADGEDDPRWEFFEAVALLTPRVACHGDGLGRLCAALRGTRLRGVDVGEVLAFTHQATDNLFANTGYFEAADMRYHGAWALGGDGLDVAAIARQQADARRLAESYDRLERIALADPCFLTDELAEVIAAAAEGLGLPVTWPGADDEEPDDEQPDPPGGAEAAPLAATPDAPRAAGGRGPGAPAGAAA